jgi:phage-related protein
LPNVILYQTSGGKSPVEDFLNSLTFRQRAKALNALTLLGEAGYSLGPPWLEKIEGEIWELRVHVDKVRLRFLFRRVGTDFVVLHALKKKAQRLPAKDIATAHRRGREYG